MQEAQPGAGHRLGEFPLTTFAGLQVSFDSVTLPASPGETGTVVDLEEVQDGYLLYRIATGSGASYVGFDGSLDNTNWYEVLAEGSVGVGAPVVSVGSLPARYLRAKGQSATGSPLISAYVARAED